MYNYTCPACDHVFSRPDKAPDDFPCPKCGKRMDVQVVVDKNKTVALWIFPLWLLIAIGVWFVIRAFDEKQPDPPVPVQQQPAK